MLYFCALCGGPLTPGLRLCQCGQVFGHPVPDFDVQGEPGARYWPPRQPSSAEATFHRTQNWWSGISNKHKAVVFGVAAVLLVAMVGAGNRSDPANLPPSFGDLKPYRNPDYKLPTQVPPDAYPNSYAQRPSASVLPAPSPYPAAPLPVAIQPWFYPAQADMNIAVGSSEITNDWVGIANTDGFDYTNVQIVINPGGGNYALQTAVLHPSTGRNNDGTPYISDEFNYAQFADPAGNRFQSGMKINSIQLTCDTPSGRAIKTITFNG